MNPNRQQAHDAATEAWSNIGRRSRTAGLAEMVRGSHRKPQTAKQRATRQKQHKDRLHAATALAITTASRFDVKALDRSRYFPHQSDRERNRRIAQSR